MRRAKVSRRRSVDARFGPARLGTMEFCRTLMCYQPMLTSKRRVNGMAAITLIALIACKGETPRPRNDTIAPIFALPDSVTTVSSPVATWDSAAGSAFLVVGTSPQEAGLVLPEFTSDVSLDSAHFDLTRLRNARVELIAGGRVVGEATVSDLTSEGGGCPVWPRARLTQPGGAGTIPPWSVAFVAGRTKPVRVDSIESLSSTDSARLAIDVAKVASALPEDTSRVFQGLPFNVRSALRFSPAPGVEGFIAEVRRSLNLEANPRQEHLLIIGERESAQRNERFRTAYFERSSGPEETVETTDVLAIVEVAGRALPSIVLSRDFGDGVAFALLERDNAGKWKLRWTSAYAGC